jgi:septin family protein
VNLHTESELYIVIHYYFFKKRLKPIDIIVLKKLVEVANVVPVIAKSDTLTLEERAAFKKRVRLVFLDK